MKKSGRLRDGMMMRYKKVILILTVLTGFVLINPTWAAAEEIPPALPCVFYGTVQENGENVETGTIVSAKLDGAVIASTTVKYDVDGNTVYSMNVPGSEEIEEDAVTFFIDSTQADHDPAAWRSGTINIVDLSITTETNEAPVAVADSFETMKNKQLLLPGDELTDNDTDADGDSLSVVAVLNPQHGTVQLSGGTITFTPAAGFVGVAGFDYRVSDGALNDTAHVTVKVVEKVFIPLFFK